MSASARIVAAVCAAVALGVLSVALSDLLLGETPRHQQPPACREAQERDSPRTHAPAPRRGAPNESAPPPTEGAPPEPGSTAHRGIAPGLARPVARPRPGTGDTPSAVPATRASDHDKGDRQPPPAEASPRTDDPVGVEKGASPPADEHPERMIWSLDPQGIRGAVGEARADIAECYSGWLAAHPDLEGRATVEFVIRAEGEGDDAHGAIGDVALAESELGHGLMEGCILNVMTGLRFEAPDEPLTVRFPFDLTAR